MTDYFLPRPVHFCCRGDAFVFLDLARDRYVLVNDHRADALRNRLRADTIEDVDQGRSALQSLVQDGLLTTDATHGKQLCVTTTEPAIQCLVEPDVMSHARPGALHVLRFIHACIKTATRLRWSRIQDTVTAIELRKRRNSSSRWDLETARTMTAVFHRLRSLFPRNYLCLFDSLALLEFLAHYRIYPTWVFGVRLEPWAAHCWVQDGNSLLDENPEEAARCTPIMTV